MIAQPREIVRLAHRYFTQLDILGIEDSDEAWLWFVSQHGIDKEDAAKVRAAIDTINEEVS